MEPMIPLGYLAKSSCKKPSGFNIQSIVDVYSVSSDVNDSFADYINYWKHNGYWFFDSPSIIRDLAKEAEINLDGTLLFYYEAHELEFDGAEWRPFAPGSSMKTDVELPAQKRLEGFDIVTFFAGNAPECSPLSCNGLADKLPTNRHCLLETFQEAESHLNAGSFNGSEPGPYRIFAVYSVDWP